jgi:hypothetical protein
MTHDHSDRSNYHSARENGDDEPRFGLPVRFELCGKRTIGEVLEFAAPNELGEPGPPDALEVSGARAPQRLVDLWMASGKCIREVTSSPD